VKHVSRLDIQRARAVLDVRTNLGQKAAQEAWETPLVKVRDRGAWATAKSQIETTENQDPLGHVVMEE
jgi:hypothetical protein